MAERPPSVLDLSIDQPERATVDIAGRAYELAEPDDYSLIEQRTINRDVKRLSQLEDAETLSEDEAVELDGLYRSLTRLALPDVPEDLLGRLRYAQMSAVIAAFFAVAAVKRQQLTPRVTPAPSATPSPPSSGSTAAASESGS